MSRADDIRAWLERFRDEANPQTAEERWAYLDQAAVYVEVLLAERDRLTARVEVELGLRKAAYERIDRLTVSPKYEWRVVEYRDGRPFFPATAPRFSTRLMAYRCLLDDRKNFPEDEFGLERRVVGEWEPV